MDLRTGKRIIAIVFRIFSLALLIGMMTLIFHFSAETSEQSSQTGTKVVEKVAKVVYSDFESFDEEEQERIVDSLQFAVRKTAHFSLFAALGFSAMLCAQSFFFGKTRRNLLSSLVFSLLYATSDELHQLAVSGRSCELRDVCIDFAGAFVGVLICLGLCGLAVFAAKKRFP